MKIFNSFSKKKIAVLALGPESEGNFSIYQKKKIFLSENFGDLLEEKKFFNFKKAILDYLKKNKIKPEIILTDLHPLYKTTIWGQQLVKKFKVRNFQIQHHIAHIFSVIGEKLIENYKLKIENCLGIACDGTGYGLDGKIWGGEVFEFKIQNAKCKMIERIGHLENQIMIGGDLAIKEPARMLISILNKVKRRWIKDKTKVKNETYKFVKEYYSREKFEVLYNQFQQNFNCYETSSTGRILDTVSILLGFAKNQRNYKHEPIDLLEKNSTAPYAINPKISYDKKEKKYILLTTPLFDYLIKNLHRDKKRLAATAQIYLAKGLYKIILNSQFSISKQIQNCYFGGGIANNKIISNYLEKRGIITNKTIPRGDAGISFGQVISFLMVVPIKPDFKS